MKFLRRVARYFAEIIYYVPRAIVEAWTLCGWRGIYMVLCTWVFRAVPIPVRTRWGHFASWQEVANFVDNFIVQELRCDSVEEILISSPRGQVVDLGVNVGVTIRWWLGLSPNASVIGIDMFQESIDFTTARLPDTDRARWTGICGAVDSENRELAINFDQPLEGMSSIHASHGRRTRTVNAKPLDEWLRDVMPERITLLKVDIEGAGGRALQGATKTLSRTDAVVLETHDREELRVASDCLIANGFSVLHFRGRTIWWTRARQPAGP